MSSFRMASGLSVWRRLITEVELFTNERQGRRPSVAEVRRIYDAKLQGLHLLVNLRAPGSRSPWVIE